MLDTADYSDYLPYIKERWENRHKAWAQRRKKAWVQARRVAGMLREKYGAEQVIAFGSLVGDGRYDEHSDIDLAVSGLPARQYFSAFADAMMLAIPFEVDLVDLDTCRAEWREHIVAQGTLL